MSAKEVIQGYVDDNEAKLEQYYAGQANISTEHAAVLRGQLHAYRKALEAIASEQAAPAELQAGE